MFFFIFFFRRLFDEAFQYREYVAPDNMKTDEWRVRNNLEGSGHGLIETPFGIYVKGLRKTTKTPVKKADVSAEIRIEHIPYTSLQICSQTSLFSNIHTEDKHGKKQNARWNPVWQNDNENASNE
jgi:hypothetical protein